MSEYCEQYKVFVLSRYSEALERSKEAMIFLEQVISLEHIAPGSFGTRDVAIASDGILDVIDLKYGKGVEVSAEENEQLMLYGAGTLFEVEDLLDIHTVRLNIFQPRIDNYSTWEISAKNLHEWVDRTVKPQAKLAHAGKGTLVAGDHCMFCRAKINCTALAKYNLEITRHEFAEPTELTSKELVEIFLKSASLVSWVNSIKDFMLKQSLEKNKSWPGLKLVAGKSSGRTIADEKKAIAKFKANKIRSDFYLSEPTLLGITALNKTIGEAKVAKILGGLIIKPEGKPTLVDKKDPRPEFQSAEAARKAFGVLPKTKPITKTKTKLKK